MAFSGFTSPTGPDNSSVTTSSLNRARSHSISSDQPSANGHSAMLSPPALVQPQPLFLAISAASQIVTNDHDSHSEAWFDQHGLEPSGEIALVNPGALKLVNNFLDQLLFNFLAISKSTSLASLRPAVVETLKPKLAKEAIHQADQELEEYLGGGDDEELISFHNGIEPSGDWDLELVWKRTRLRCMVYSSLGDMEEEDEDHYTELDHLDGPPGSTNRYSNSLGVVSPAVAIFLTSILEFMGEQALTVAGQAAYHRIRSKQQKDERDGSSVPKNVADRVVVEDVDMERVALDRTLGRLWRGWKKRIRSPNASISHSVRRSYSRNSMQSRPHSRRGSLAPEHQVPEINHRFQDTPINEPEEEDEGHPQPTANDEEPVLFEATIPLPMGEDDVREIEIPGVADQSGDEADDEVDEPKQYRRKSMMIFTANTKGLPTPTNSQPATPGFLSAESRKRSHSLPSPAASAFASPMKRRKSTDEDKEPAVEQDKESEIPALSRTVSQDSEDTYVLAAEEPSKESKIVSQIPRELDAEKSSESETVSHSKNELYSSHKGGLIARVAAGATAIGARPASVRSKRSASVHSIRLIEVSSPRRPSSCHASSDLTSRPPSLKGAEGTDAAASRGTSPVQKTPSGSPILKAPSPLINQVSKDSEASLPEVIEPENLGLGLYVATVPRSVPVPVRSPLRESPKTKLTSETLSVQDTQFAVIPQDSYRNSNFFLGTAPRPKSTRDADSLAAPSTPASLKPTCTDQVDSPGSGTSAPPLTPLREMMENAPDTSDEASSIAPSYSDASIFQSDLPAGSYSGPGRKDAHTRNRTNASDRSVARSSPPRSHREEDTGPKPEFLNKSARQGSSSSSIKSYKVRPIRTSEESTSAIEDKGQTFEQLIRSETTLQYTLTPSNMRGIDDIPESPLLPRQSSFGPRSTPLGSPMVASFFGGNSASSPKVSTFFGNGKEASDIPKSPVGGTRFAPNPAVRSAPPPKSGARVRPNAPQARDAKVTSESISDFANFIRSTGPPQSRDSFAVQPPPRQANISAHLISAPSVPIVVAKSLASTGNRNRLQARDAVVQRDNLSSSELIDFIRQGPPSDKSHDNPRIPRTVAPFRTTMDSDQMSTALSGNRLSTLPEGRDPHMNFSMDTSIHTSTTANSSSAMKKPALPEVHLDAFDEKDMKPKRKTHRVKDPYAIDYSDDEDDEDEFTLPEGPPKRVEESLIDFLNSVPPPDTSTMSSIFDEPTAPPPKKTIMARFSRSNSAASSSSTSTRNSVLARNNVLPRNSSLPQHPSASPKTKKHTPISPSYSTTPPRPRSNYASHVTLQRKPGSRASQKPSPREATHSRNTPSSDLADFLTNTLPPPSSRPIAKEQGGFSRMFGRRNKAV
ncbi:hypothetical protein VC83_03055 [Pseudogymnoascus destructans]|uniref:Uncharacterized protein n=2 Tax=Pseudogymnoascus destructans TaxID=655981 RepID=L8FQP8_PSED2|nr:uncharacterized protein VC83_03055 [Pseudogymnoascus destructans]ELR02869.1 hypothetical protein GMDG_05801 [Pseudogymnoascus destructans 20631-21]OAF59959.1 hypothetical protein VC83_03055 [Pseudogymnoascus destructans]